MWWLLACTQAIDSAPKATPEEQLIFRFAILADSHVYSNEGENLPRLDAAVDWLNAADGLSLVLILGDIGWDEGLPLAAESLERLNLPWVPINGDNEIQNGQDDQVFEDRYAAHYQQLEGQLEGWYRAEVPVEDPESNSLIYLHNLAFDMRGVHFVGLDWAQRVLDPVLGELGSLHDFPGGTLPYLEQELQHPGISEHIVLFSHLPMHLGGFTLTDNDRLQSLILPRASMVYANYAGHYHGDAEEEEEGGYRLVVTDATWDDAVEVRVVEVYSDGQHFRYEDFIEVVEF